MCGIVGYAGNKKALNKILTGLKSLEYRGYDSSGIAYIKDDEIKIIKKEGPIKNLEENINYDELKKELTKKGYAFKSGTDTEVAAAVIDDVYNKEKDMIKVLNKITHILKGSYAFNIINDDYKDIIFGIRKDSPLIVGVGENENVLASDIPAIVHITNKYVVLDNYDVVYLTKSNVKYYNREGKEIQKTVKEFPLEKETISKNGYDHFMLKEINEEPELVKKLLNLYTENNKVKDIFDIKKYKNIDIVACGSASFAGQLGKYYIEKFANIRVNVYFASEYRYQTNFFDKDTLVILISQSGETADTLASLKLAKENNIDTLAIVNRHESSIAREAKYVIYTEAGIEVAVATTKAYLAQVLVLLFLAIKGSSIEEETINSLKLLPNIFTKYINEYNYEEISKIMVNKTNIFYLGRLVDYYLAMEGSLKLKEISYIHSEAFQAGELKHGSISLIDKDFGVIAVVTDKEISEKTISNLKEVESRGANIVTITNIKDDDFSKYKILLDDYNEVLNPLMAIIPMQLLAYNIAKLKGCDIDKPRNLAKSVTVE